MGVPKFFRYISERYPCLSESVKNYEIPTFDNLYLDMNGIIHMCTHPDDTDCHFRISEQKIFENIFHYIEILFSIIKPQKLFFMAVDGVAPRAKMNQQRGRRFRTAKESEILLARAKAKSEILPDTPRFDSNCITPGTAFMARLNEQLKYFVTYKITKDKLWKKCKIIFSGHETPGEGEHKIMDYIRYMKTQPDYDNNTRHCLYGLDADLIMLSLCTHEPHFSLLREEVKFVKKQKRNVTAEETKFCLLHLSLMREYLEHEFSSIKDKLPFPFDIEKIIDDWVLMGFLVGNDFIPNLPNLHISNGSLSVLYHAYMEVLPTLDGYINESGTLKLDRFEKFMEKLSHVDMEQFIEHYIDLKYFESKTGRRPNESDAQSNDASENVSEEVTPTKNKDLEDLIKSTNDMMEDSDEEELSDLEEKTIEFIQHKRDYYIQKLEYEDVTENVLRSQAEGYIRAIQWNLNYYYNGCCSWSWYYPHHYAPYISDIKDFKDLKLEFELGEPFLPFQQLLAVLPAASKDLLPKPFQQLLTEETSPIIKCYPTDFITDLNGKKQEWEAVVLIPFIDEKRLLDAMKPYYEELTLEEKARNKHGPMCIYTHSEEDLGSYNAPDYFPELENNHAKLELLNREDIFVPQEKLVRGLCPGVKLSVYYPGFPTLWHIEHTARLLKAKVKVFEQSSRNENMILFIKPKETPKLTDLTNELLGKSVFVAWPHLVEARVVALSNQEYKISLFDPLMEPNSKNIRKEEVKGSLAAEWNLQRKAVIEKYKNSLGIDVGNTDILVHACTVIGKKYVFDTQGKFRIETQWNERSVAYAYQTVLNNIEVHISNTTEYNYIKEIFIPKSTCFMLGHPHYGAMGEVIEPGVNSKTSRVKVAMRIIPLPNLDCVKQEYAELKAPYMHGSVAAQRLGISSHLLSRITGTIYVIEGSKEQSILEKSERPKHNVGLNLKFNKKNEEIPGYTRKDNGQWFYSIKSVNLIRAYMQKCPDLFEQMVKNVTNDVFYEDELFSKRLKLHDVVSWLQNQPFYNLERRACGTESLDVEVIQKLEKEVDGFTKSRNITSKSVVMQVKPHLLFVPGLNSGNLPPDMAARHEICDRIVCVRENFTVPLGYNGTIIGIQKKETSLESVYDILFDEPLLGGLSLNSQSNNRGYRLRVGDFINISHGIRVESVKTGKTNVDTSMSGFMSLPPQHNQSRFNASGFVPLQNRSSFPLTGFKNNYPGHVPQMHVIRSGEVTYQSSRTMHVHESQKKAQHELRLVPDYVTQNSEQSTSVQNVQKPTSEQATEFQALWNELHKIQKTNDSVPKSVSVPTSVKPKQVASTNADSPQDPSAYLKAMLKISNEESQNNAQPRNVAPLSNRKLPTFSQVDTPPLVKQLFDHARQIEDKKDEILYCSAILTHFQLNGMGMPQYTYLSNSETKLVCAQIVLPDMRIFTGGFCSTKELAAESAAKKVYKELNLDKAPKVNMNMLVAPPQQWYNCRQTNMLSQNIRPVMIHGPPQIPANAQNPLINAYKWNSKVPQNSQFTPMSNACQIRPQQRQNYSTEQNTSKNWRIPDKPESKKIAPFVPLQAQKQSRNVGSRYVKKDNDRNSNKPPQSKVQKEKPKETSTKETKEEALNTTDQKVPRGQNNSQNQQKIPKKQRKSRIAANFDTERGQAQ